MAINLQEMHQFFSEDAWEAFHGGDINNQDDFYEFLHEWIDNAVIYTSDCEDILKNNMEYCFDEHDVYGRAENVGQAAYACAYDYIMDNDDTVTWEQMEHVLNEANND